jgi:hypothetical protein
MSDTTSDRHVLSYLRYLHRARAGTWDRPSHAVTRHGWWVLGVGCWMQFFLPPPRTQHSCILNLCKSVTFYHHRHFEVHHQTDITMKFLSAALLALAHGSEASKFSTSDLNRMVESGKIDKQRLLRNAIPVARKMENYNNQQYNNGGNVSFYSSLF